MGQRAFLAAAARSAAELLAGRRRRRALQPVHSSVPTHFWATDRDHGGPCGPAAHAHDLPELPRRNRHSHQDQTRTPRLHIGRHHISFGMFLWLLPHSVLHRQLHGDTSQVSQLWRLPRPLPIRPTPSVVSHEIPNT